jgi:DNA-directed RNA polymerase specialized sigma24 family protein
VVVAEQHGQFQILALLLAKCAGVPYTQRQKLLLTLYSHGMSIRELAAALEVSPAVVATAIRTARAATAVRTEPSDRPTSLGADKASCQPARHRE